jgi:hypothetical protein
MCDGYGHADQPQCTNAEQHRNREQKPVGGSTRLHWHSFDDREQGIRYFLPAALAAACAASADCFAETLAAAADALASAALTAL